VCGILGIAGSESDRITPRQESLFKQTVASLSHRGPDGKGIWTSPDGRVMFGHTRLAILDLSNAAAQPMSTSDGRYTIVYNGEIYNFRELRDDLSTQEQTAY